MSWSPRELRHTFVSLMSDTGVPVEEIARLAGHTSTRTTEIVYRHQLRVMEKGAQAMDPLFGRTRLNCRRKALAPKARVGQRAHLGYRSACAGPAELSHRHDEQDQATEA
jgi:hypothetical protein